MTNYGVPRRVSLPQRRRNGYRACFEAMPRIQRRRNPDRIYGRAELGRMCDLLLLDQRQHRDPRPQPCGDPAFTPCPDANAPGRDYLGRKQMGWLKRRLAGSEARWKLLGNQLMLMAFDLAPGVPVVQDSWEGYGAERRELANHIVDAGVDDVLALTGDIHTFCTGRITTTGRAGGAPAAVELVGGSITSLGVKETLGGLPVENLTDVYAAANPHISYANFDRRGYGVLSLHHDRAVCEFKSPRTVAQRDAIVTRLAAFEIAAGSRDVQRIA